MIFLDSGNLDAVREWRSWGIVEGVTTNPTILRKQGVVDVEKHLVALTEAAGGHPVAIEVLVTDLETTLADALRLHSLAPNIVVKVPVVAAAGRPALDVVRRLSDAGITVNATACFTVGQMVLAARAGAAYTTVFWSRIWEEGGDAVDVVASARALFDRHGQDTKILVGSMRRTDDITRSLLAGADVVTVPPALLTRWADHHYSRESAAEFDRDERERLRLAAAG